MTKSLISLLVDEDAYFDWREEQPLQYMKDLPSEWPTDERD